MYPKISIKETDRILIVAPHPDDETIGCGGILANYGPQCDVLLLTDGRLGKPEGSNMTEDAVAETRHQEFISVMEFFHVNRYMELGVPDGQMQSNEAATSNVNLRTYDLVFVPNRNERHPDHKAAYEIFDRKFSDQKADGDLIEYEVWSPIIHANRFLDITDAMESKITGLLRYQSQIAALDYENLTRGLNMYRGAPFHIPYCEAYDSRRVRMRQEKENRFSSMPEWLRAARKAAKRAVKGK